MELQKIKKINSTENSNTKSSKKLQVQFNFFAIRATKPLAQQIMLSSHGELVRLVNCQLRKFYKLRV